MDEAYELAGYKRNSGNSSTMANMPAIVCRLKEIKDEMFKFSQITAESLAQEADEVRQMALKSGQLSAAVAAIKEKGVLTGKRIERSEIGAPGEFEAMSDEELEHEVLERFAALGFKVESDTAH